VTLSHLAKYSVTRSVALSSDTGALWTDRQTDGQNCYINIARQCADAW